MNGAPTIAEAPPLDGNAIAELAEQLNQLLRLRTFAIGMKLFEDLEEMSNVSGLRRPPKGNIFSTSSAVNTTRRLQTPNPPPQWRNLAPSNPYWAVELLTSAISNSHFGGRRVMALNRLLSTNRKSRRALL